MTKFCRSVDVRDLITRAAFCDDRLRGLGAAGVEFSVFPLTCVVALTTLALPCECVITSTVGVVRSRDLILQYNVKFGNKTANINIKNC